MNERILFRKCPLCDCLDVVNTTTGDCASHPLYHSSLSRAMRWKRCARCAHVFTEGYFTEEACKLIFSKTHPHQQVGFGLEAQRITSARMIEKILPYAATGNWLDVGFGNGSLLFTAQEYGFTPIGLDLRLDNVNSMKSLGVDSYCQDIATFTLRTPCSVISMADVLEHMPYPQNALRSAHRLLADAGVLFISMPNLESIVWKALDQQKANPYWGELEHYHNFGRTRLYQLLRAFGFEPVRYGVSERYRVCMEVIARKICTACA